VTMKTSVPDEVKRRLAEIKAGRWPTDPTPVVTIAPPKKG